ncbi:MAG: D-tyrosyl-tRNA(Tyr) deacylase [Mollicutes bacterium]|nr:D-tyrosyl-tRNA(Tyr) deacylase [Mollicutes bacterium]
MRAVVQRVRDASVEVDSKEVGAIDYGLLVYVGFNINDQIEDMDYVVNKIKFLRIFSDKDDIMNLDINSCGSKILSISQFTLYADVSKGRRPSYDQAMKSETANEYYQLFNKKLREAGLNVEEGIFQSEMKIKSINEGPITIIIDSKERKNEKN